MNDDNIKVIRAIKKAYPSIRNYINGDTELEFWKKEQIRKWDLQNTPKKGIIKATKTPLKGAIKDIQTQIGENMSKSAVYTSHSNIIPITIKRKISIIAYIKLVLSKLKFINVQKSPTN